MANDQNFRVKNGLTVGAGAANIIANATTISIGTATVNSTVYSGTANNATNFNGQAASFYVGNTYMQGLGYVNSTVGTAFNSSNLNSQPASFYVGNTYMQGLGYVNSTSGTAFNSSNLAGIPATSYVNTAGAYTLGGVITHNANITFSGNSTSQVLLGTIGSGNGVIVTNNTIIIGNSTVNTTISPSLSSQITGNAATAFSNAIANAASNAASIYQTMAGLSANVATLTAANAGSLGGVAAANYLNNSGAYSISGVHTHTANIAFSGNATSRILVGTIGSGNGIVLANNSINIGNSTVNATVTSNSTVVYFTGTAYNANNSAYLGGFTWASPDNIGTTTPAVITSSQINMSGSIYIANGYGLSTPYGVSIIGTTAAGANVVVGAETGTVSLKLVSSAAPVMVYANNTLSAYFSANGNVILGGSTTGTGTLTVTQTDATDASYYNFYQPITLSNTTLTDGIARTKAAAYNLITNLNQFANSTGGAQDGRIYGNWNQLFNGDNTTGGNAYMNILYGSYNQLYNYANGATANAITTAVGAYNQVRSVRGPITTAMGTYSEISQTNTSSGNIGTAYGNRVVISGNATPAITLGILFSGVYANAGATNSYGVYVSGENRNYFSGQVGIGQTIPAYDLDVTGNIRATANLYGSLANTTVAANLGTIGSWVTGNAATAFANAIANAASNAASLYLPKAGGTITGDLSVGANLYIATNSKYLIGTASDGTNVAMAYITSTNNVYLGAGGTFGNVSAVRIVTGANSGASVFIQPNNSTAAVFSANGNVGIGDNTPTSKLSVTGDITVTTGNVIAVGFSGNGAALTTLNATSITTGTLPIAQIPAAVVNTSGNFTVAGNIAFTGANTTTNGVEIGYLDIPQRIITTTNTIIANDAGSHLYNTNTTGTYAVTVPNNTSLALRTGTAVTIINGGNTITIAGGTGVTLRLAGTATTGTRTLANNAVATLIKVAAETWYISGSGVS